uniref:NADH dehydrogenase subunit 1 n=1 Tax=Xylophaga washingtona TaxID=1049057 RepID=UPI0020288CC9|nr:NADH dehydrogenase subunit 1 [Xylophaga washingtona]UPX88941.1 NADH dehydrogenase subunit 1 [Xylophaga washingtona]UPX88953.1 NADH dehydrogenase subunit 1 [Xylophaga washingtona]
MIVGSAFLVVTERKGLGMVQLRQGPNKAGFKGLVQPVADGLKLLKKEIGFTHFTSFNKFMVGPSFCFFLACLVWLVFPSYEVSENFELGFLFFLCVSSLNVYGVFMCGWCCNSRYGLLGAMRGVAQTISYEVVLSTVLFCPLLLMGTFDMTVIRSWSFINVVVFFEVFVLWIIILMAETNRAPFDFVEGESEIVSGYSVEYGGGAFAMIALAEYSNIFFMSVLSSVFFFSGPCLYLMPVISDFYVSVLSVLVCYFVIMVRGAYPRFRYDLLMDLCWRIMLPFSFCALSFYCCFC